MATGHGGGGSNGRGKVQSVAGSQRLAPPVRAAITVAAKAEGGRRMTERVA